MNEVDREKTYKEVTTSFAIAGFCGLLFLIIFQSPLKADELWWHAAITLIGAVGLGALFFGLFGAITLIPLPEERNS